jgi:hydroxymethylbilane synthase
MTPTKALSIGSRGSPLALAQARQVQSLLAAGGSPCRIAVIKTTGDAILDRPLAEIGGKGLFTKEIDEALLGGDIDLAVHSLKDVPTVLPDGLVLACVPERADPRDGLISTCDGGLAALPAGAVVGTASLRRAAQILRLRPDLRVTPLRGNVGTRLNKLGDGKFAATLLAMAGLARLGLSPPHLTALATEQVLPAVAQGAIGIVCRADDAPLRHRLAALDDHPSRQAVTAERALLAVLDGSCRTPIAAFAEIAGARLRLRGIVLAPDGTAAEEIDLQGGADEAAQLGETAGHDLLVRWSRWRTAP